MQDGPNPPVVETTLWELANAIDEVSVFEDETFPVLEAMLAEGRISFPAVRV